MLAAPVRRRCESRACSIRPSVRRRAPYAGVNRIRFQGSVSIPQTRGMPLAACFGEAMAGGAPGQSRDRAPRCGVPSACTGRSGIRRGACSAFLIARCVRAGDNYAIRSCWECDARREDPTTSRGRCQRGRVPFPGSSGSMTRRHPAVVEARESTWTTRDRAHPVPAPTSVRRVHRRQHARQASPRARQHEI